MKLHITYYKSVYWISHLLVFFIIPITIVTFLIFHEPQTNYEYYFKGKLLSHYFPLPMLIIVFISFILYTLRNEKAPSKLNQWLWVALLSTIIIGITSYGIALTKNYAVQIFDDIPVRERGIVTDVSVYHNKIYSGLEESKYGQIPYNSNDRIDRYVLVFTLDNGNSYETNFYIGAQFTQTKNKIVEFIGRELIVTKLPHSGRIISIENPELPGNYILEDRFLQNH